MHAMLPIISGEEASIEIFGKISKGIKKLTVLIVVDTEIKKTSYEATSFLSEAQRKAEEICEAFGKKRKSCEVIVEWGDPISKIDRNARLKGVRKIFIVESESEFVKKAVEELKKRKEYAVEIIKTK
ncbi:MAG: hypothetical protein N3F05_01640 [Candidatus Diapherotrites archaeon]|nr:hypothetical protein [Candidatus Diapherotrites archaeon]